MRIMKFAAFLNELTSTSMRGLAEMELTKNELSSPRKSKISLNAE